MRPRLGPYNYLGATVSGLKLVRAHSGPDVHIKAVGGFGHWVICCMS